MPLLAFEAAGPGVSIALGEAHEDGSARLIGVRHDDSRGAGDRLLAHVGELLAAAGLEFGALAGIVVDRGPGSFTGVRTAVAAARALSFASGCPVFAFTRFELVASALGPRATGHLAVVLRAGRDRVLLQSFTGGGQALGPPRSGRPEEALHGLARPLLIAGSGAPLVLDCAAPDEAVRACAVEVDAATLIDLAAVGMPAGLAPIRPFELEPMYPRPPDAVPSRRPIVRGDDPLPAHARAQA